MRRQWRIPARSAGETMKFTASFLALSLAVSTIVVTHAAHSADTDASSNTRRLEYLPADPKPAYIVFAGFIQSVSLANERDPDLALGLVLSAFQLGREPDQTMLGVGLGAELRLGRFIRIRVDWGRALLSTETPTETIEKGHNEVYFLFGVLY